MNWLDIVLVVILAWSTLSAAYKGFSRVVIGMVTLVVALVLAMWFYGTAGSFIEPYISSHQTANLVGFLAVVLGVYLVGALVGSIVHRFLRTVGLSWIDRLLGAAFGAVRGLLVCMVLLTGFTAFGPRDARNLAPSAMVNSRIAPYVLTASRPFVAIAPMDLKQSFRQQYEKIKKAMPSRT